MLTVSDPPLEAVFPKPIQPETEGEMLRTGI